MQPMTNVARARELFRSGLELTRQELADELGLTKGQVRKVMESIRPLLVEIPGRTQWESKYKLGDDTANLKPLKIKGETFPLYPRSAVAKMGLDPITQRLDLRDNEQFFATAVQDFRRLRQPFAFVDARLAEDRGIVVQLCRVKGQSPKNAAHAMPRKCSYKVVRTKQNQNQ